MTASSTRAVITLIRPLDCASAAAMVSLGAVLGDASNWFAVAAAAVAAFASMCFAMAINDHVDQVGDRLNERRRPLVVGALDERAVRRVAIAAAVVSIAASALVGWTAIAVIFSYLLLGALYSLRLKVSAPLGAPAVVSLLAGSTVIFGGMVGGEVGRTLPAAVIAAVFMFARELLKTARDEAGDLAQGCRTFAIAWGPRRAVRWYAAVSTLSGVLAAGPLLIGAATGYVVFAIPNFAYLVSLAIYVTSRPTMRRVARVVDLSKVSWVFWITASFAFWGG